MIGVWVSQLSGEDLTSMWVTPDHRLETQIEQESRRWEFVLWLFLQQHSMCLLLPLDIRLQVFQSSDSATCTSDPPRDLGLQPSSESGIVGLPGSETSGILDWATLPLSQVTIVRYFNLYKPVNQSPYM
jgi:hypothetical protein